MDEVTADADDDWVKLKHWLGIPIGGSTVLSRWYSDSNIVSSSMQKLIVYF